MSNCSLDTNSILSLILIDRDIHRNITEKKLQSNMCHVADQVFIELEYSLRINYDFSREMITGALRSVIALDSIACNKELLVDVLGHYEVKPALSLTDILITIKAKNSGNAPLYTFDKKLASQMESAEIPC